MSATGAGGMAGLNDLIGGWLRGGQQGGQVVGQENPEWDFPLGQDRVPDSVRSLLLRSDAGPTGINQYLAQELQKNPKLIDEIRSAINMGVLRPKNAAAQNITTGYGGYRAGDMTALGPLINGMPSGLNESQLNTLANILNTAADYQIGLIEATGYFDGKPTWQVQKEKEELAQGWKDRATNEFIAMETQRGNMANEGLKGEELTNQNMQKMAELFGGQMVTGADGQSTWAPTEAAQEFATQQSGYLNGQATLTREQQAFNQAKDVANLASNPRNYIEAQMLQNSRGGLNGMAPNNQVDQTTFGPATTAGQQSPFQVPGGQGGQVADWQKMLGNTVAQRSAATSAYGQPAQAQRAGQMGGNSPAPEYQALTAAQSGGQPGIPGGPENPGEQPLDLSNPKTWAGYAQDANKQWTSAQQGMAGGLNNNPAWANMVSSQQNYQQGGTTPGWQTPQNGSGPFTEGPGSLGQTSISPVNPATGLRFDENTGQYTSAPLPTAQQNYDSRMRQFQAQGLPTGFTPMPEGGRSQMERELTMVDDTNWTPEQRAQWEAQSRQAMPAAMAERDRQRSIQMGQLPGANGMGQIEPWFGGRTAQQGAAGQPGQAGFGATGAQPGDGMSQFGVMPGANEQMTEQTLRQRAAQLPNWSGQPAQPALQAAQQMGQLPNKGQDVAGANQGFQLPTSNFTQSLLQNRVVPKTGALNTAGKMVSGQQFQNSFNPQKVRPQDYLRGTNSQQQGFNAAGSYAGFSDQDLSGIMKSNLPSFKAPSAGKMI